MFLMACSTISLHFAYPLMWTETNSTSVQERKAFHVCNVLIRSGLGYFHLVLMLPGFSYLLLIFEWKVVVLLELVERL